MLVTSLGIPTSLNDSHLDTGILVLSECTQQLYFTPCRRRRRRSIFARCLDAQLERDLLLAAPIALRMHHMPCYNKLKRRRQLLAQIPTQSERHFRCTTWPCIHKSLLPQRLQFSTNSRISVPTNNTLYASSVQSFFSMNIRLMPRARTRAWLLGGLHASPCNAAAVNCSCIFLNILQAQDIQYVSPVDHPLFTPSRCVP